MDPVHLRVEIDEDSAFIVSSPQLKGFFEVSQGLSQP